MPRETLELQTTVDRLSILSADGEVDSELEPELDDDLLVGMYRTMVRARRFDELLLEWQRGGRIGTFAPVTGQEAAQVGAVSALEESDWFVPAFREIAASLWRGWDPVQMTVFNAGYNEGAKIPDDARDFPIAVPVATQIPHAAGIAYATRLREEDDVVMTFFGDGATSEGDFHEALNFAGTFSVPAVFVCQNNQWAISTPVEDQTASATLAQKGVAYGVPGIQVDGNDVLGVHVAAREAVERARKGDGPTLLECVTYRLSLHTTADDPTRYRDEEEVEAWKEKDPIPRLRNYLLDREILDESSADELEDEVEEELSGVWEEAESRMAELGGPEVMFEHIHAEMPADLEAQRKALLEEEGDRPDAAPASADEDDAGDKEADRG